MLFSFTSTAGVENNRGRQERRGSLRPSCDAEFAKALKVFYHSMTSVRGQLQRLRRHKPSVTAQVWNYSNHERVLLVIHALIVMFLYVCVYISIGGSRPARSQTVRGWTHVSPKGLFWTVGTVRHHSQTGCGCHCTPKKRKVWNLVLIHLLNQSSCMKLHTFETQSWIKVNKVLHSWKIYYSICIFFTINGLILS